MAETGSTFAEDLLIHWDLEIGNFWQVVPNEIAAALEHQLVDGEDALESAGSD